jgi:hypothetical protein
MWVGGVVFVGGESGGDEGGWIWLMCFVYIYEIEQWNLMQLF